VGAGIETPSGDIKADFRKKGLKEFLLVGSRVVTTKIFTGGRLRQGECFFGNGDESWAEFSKKSCNVFGEPAWFVAFKESIVRLVGVAPEVGHLAGECEKFFKVWGEGGEVRIFSGLDPCGAGEADGELVFFDKFGGDASGAVVIVAPSGDGGGFGGVGWEGSAFTIIKPAGDVGVGREAVGDARKEGGLFGTEGVAFRGEQGFLVPAEEACGGAEKGKIFASGAKFFVGFREGGHAGMMKQEKVL